MSDTNPTGMIKDLIKDFDDLVKDIDKPMYKTYLKDCIKSNLERRNKDIPREIIDKFVELVYLTDHA
jgi:hypothetical protein